MFEFGLCLKLALYLDAEIGFGVLGFGNVWVSFCEGLMSVFGFVILIYVGFEFGIWVVFRLV